MTNGLQHLIFFRLIPAVFCLFLSCTALNATSLPDSVSQKTFTLNMKKAPVERVLDEISKQTGLLFSFRTSTLSELNRFSFSKKSFTIESFLQQVFLPNGINYSFIAPNVIVLKPINAPSPKRFVVSGVIIDSLSGERLVGANIFLVLDKRGIVTNNEGFYSFQQSSDSLLIKVSYVGFNTKTIALKLGSNIRLDISLSPSILLNPVQVSNNNEVNSVNQEGGNTITLKGKQITEISPLFGEADVFRTLQLLPGVQSVGEGTPGLYVRGGSPDQNLVLLDGVQLYNPVHIFGFYSIFNPGIVSNVTLSKGPFAAKHGGRLSSVIDIVTKDGNNQKIKGEAMLGIMGSRLLLEGPIGKSKKTTFLASARRSHIDFFLSPFVDANLSTQNAGFLSAYYFYDLNAKVVHRFNKNSKLIFSFYNGQDKVSLNNTFKLDNPQRQIQEKDLQSFSWGNTAISAKWQQILSAKSILRVSTWYSSYDFGNKSEYSFRETIGNSSTLNFFEYKFKSNIQDIGARVDLDYFIFKKWAINLGAHTINHAFQPGVTTLTSNLPNLEPETNINKSNTGLESAVYLDNQIKIGRKTVLNLGAHFTMFSVENTNYFSLQPRFSLVRYLTKNITLSTGYSKMQQFMHLLTNSTIGIPSDLWILSSENIAPQVNNQWNASIQYKEKSFVAGIDAFSKRIENVLEYRDGANYLKTNSNWEEKVVAGIGNSNGIEFYIEKTWGKFTGWAGYCLSKSTRQFEEINEGEPFLFRYDRRHDVSSTASYQINKSSVISINYVFATGTPITLPEQIYSGVSNSQPVVDIYIPGKRNDFIMPNYHRMDINYSHQKVNNWGKRVWSFGFYNASNRQNPFFITPAYNDQGQRILRQVTLFPIIPSISYRQQF